MKRMLAIFLLLQIADFATTITVIAMGGAEKNPLVLGFMGMGTLTGLLVAKLVVMALAAGIALAGREKVLRLASYAFGAIVLWNLTVIGRLMMA